MSLEFRHIAHAYGEGSGRVRALEDISFTAPTGEITCLLGSSGCGKSTLLNLAAGLLDVQQGEIALGGEVLADPSRNPPPEKRPVGLVFQDGALFPHMNVATNIAFGLGGSDQGAVSKWLDHVGLANLGERYPHELSGGQQQRAALARAMAPGPQVLLMDEPFASVDIVLRRRLRRDCRLLLKEQGATTILVTHDPSEALDVADRIAVMEGGRIIQFGTPKELHDTPQAASVGAIFGGAQTIKATRGGDGLHTEFGDWPLECLAGELPEGDRFDLLVAANNMHVFADENGLLVRDRHVLRVGERIVMTGKDGGEITFEGLAGMEPSDRYRVLPGAGSVRAFATI
ncbi:ABC transporter ATP-binding protein [Erythrobacter sp. F6033]|uniref:ABC transporter ATP-binding protein n=1 Tax=Erythrobacter sp. F6033 TaxID=2926401 RepID=UPI001FF18696|nr:ABC transporter ATP-binding protein [Erythrobacter sp. F6033]MCK0127686.1 ABC transporter ATP-binding protein [Erythrobacter sp. F6033]